MKITCDSCGANYAIADAKVLGRLVKVRCKSCGATILVDGRKPAQPATPEPDERPAAPPEPPPAPEPAAQEPPADQAPPAAAPPAPDEDEATRIWSGGSPAAPAGAGEEEPEGWSVNLSDTDQRTMSTEQIVDGFLAGEVTDDAFVWKEGMDDWVPVLEVAELRDAIEARQPPKSAPPQPAFDFGAGVAAAPAPKSEPKPQAARVAAAPAKEEDLFGNVAMAGSEADAAGEPEPPAMPTIDEKMIGARNENSVLFSLDALMAGAIGGAPPGKAGKAAPAPPKAGALEYGKASAPVEDVLGIQAPSMAQQIFAPDANQALLTAPAPEPPKPKPKPKPVEAEQPEKAPEPAPAKKGGLGKLIGLAAGVIALVAAGLVGGMMLGRGEPQAVAQNEATGQDEGEPAQAAGEESRAEQEQKAEDDEPEEQKAEDDEPEKQKAEDDEPEKQKAEDDKKPVSEEDRKRFEEAQKKAEEQKKAEDDKTEDKPAEAEKPPFNKGAAISALSSAAAAASGCKRPGGPTGSGRATVTFAPSGRATTANVSGGGFGGTAVGGCIASIFRRARVPAFSGSPVTVSKSFTVPK